ncbi:ribosomal rna small subunit methyltransferase j [Lucifera butyrica]|uniref:Ribosomal rna small subunit methyltransferase j n=1 Tax=Lucifera butyrica TaxID=1351585 RepID=A0A498R4D9_9FIRM|nr:class I SAM-dependent methyltransferase [Lucifera butyrica]VBB05995.1 ribosomal rna small subunit methyltransferase j [Lucifera butyrica]
MIITTVHHPSPNLEEQAHETAKSLMLPFVARENHSLAALKAQYHTENILVMTTQGPLVHTAGGEYFFHLSMADLRIKNLTNGKHDHMVTAMGLQPGMSVLDCTLGLASDAVVASFVTGEGGTVVGLEVSPAVAMIAQYGLANFVGDDERITTALRRIQVKNIDYDSYLAGLPPGSFDIIYLDPMFRCPVVTSANVKPLRYLADMRPVSRAAIEQACRVAKQRVVIKEAHESPEFKRLGITNLTGGKYSSVQYGVIPAGSH